jgi:hypothetical protein
MAKYISRRVTISAQWKVALSTRYLDGSALGLCTYKISGPLADTLIIPKIGNWWTTCMLDILHSIYPHDNSDTKPNLHACIHWV